MIVKFIQCPICKELLVVIADNLVRAELETADAKWTHAKLKHFEHYIIAKMKG